MLNRYLIAAAFFACATCIAQEPAPASPKFYKLEFVVKELSAGKVTNSRSYVTIGQAEHSNQSIRTGDKVPVSTGGGGFTYIDVGVNIDVTDIAQAGNDLRMHVTADISSAEKDPGLPNPIIRQTRWSSNVVLPLKRATVLFSSDSTGSKSQTQLELTATMLQ
ncbi:MAG TPA: hypothetical protein VG345_05225 [Bryobacteraceae bacterium]|jgi:hypothetical protein|nr:hypothetical protein [Bryobacteraceae bacterium]